MATAIDTMHPALCGGYSRPAKPEEWAVEPKLDGMRLLLHITASGIHAYSRHESLSKGVGSRDGFLCAVEDELAPYLAALDDTVLDGEAVIWNGHPDFNATMRVMGSHLETALRAQRQSGHYVSLVAFDLLRLRGDDLRHMTYDERRGVLTGVTTMLSRAAVDTGGVAHLRLAPACNLDADLDADTAYAAMCTLVGEGAVYKRRSSRYPVGRTNDWQKRKATWDADVVVTGHEMAAPGKFAGMIGAVVFGQYVDGVLVDRSQCSGMDDRTRLWITENLATLVGRCDGVNDKTHEHAPTCQHRTVMMIAHNGHSGGDAFRHPQFKAFRDDKLASDCTWDDGHAR